MSTRVPARARHTAVLATLIALLAGLGSPVHAAPAAPTAQGTAEQVVAAGGPVATAQRPAVRPLVKAQRQVRRIARQRHEAFRLVREDVRLPELPLVATREIEEAARAAQTRINARVLAAERARKVVRVRKLRAAIAAEDPAPLRQRIDAEHAAVLADVNCGPLGRALENNEDGLLGPVVALVNALCL